MQGTARGSRMIASVASRRNTECLPTSNRKVVSRRGGAPGNIRPGVSASGGSSAYNSRRNYSPQARGMLKQSDAMITVHASGRRGSPQIHFLSR